MHYVLAGLGLSVGWHIGAGLSAAGRNVFGAIAEGWAIWRGVRKIERGDYKE